MILAHKDNNGNVQSLQDHSFNVATKAREDANVIDQGDILFLLGLYHDLGKANQEFQDKLLLHPNKHVDHSSAGARYLFQKIQVCLKNLNVEKTDREFFQEICAYVISSHHGMYDILLQDETINASKYTYNRLRYRIIEGTESIRYQEDIEAFAQKLESQLSYYGYSSLDDLIIKAFENYQQAWSTLKCINESEKDFYSSCFIRLYISLLKNADILDTINAYGIIVQPLKSEEREELNQSYLSAIEEKYRGFCNPTTRLNEIRLQISERVKERGENDSAGIYRLDLPTGAGKTNLSMRYAFHQLVKQKKSRFFYITPFLSVLEQNASEIKKITGDAGVLEHHSNVIHKNDTHG